MNELLKRWTELEPKRCQQAIGLDSHPIDGSFLVYDSSGEGYWVEPGTGEEAVLLIDLAMLQALLQQAIAHHKLLFRLENTVQGTHYATVLHLETGRMGQGNDAEAAIALLKAYVAWLERNTEPQNQAVTEEAA